MGISGNATSRPGKIAPYAGLILALVLAVTTYAGRGLALPPRLILIPVTVNGIVASGATTVSGAAAGDAISGSDVQLFAAGDTTAVASATSGTDGSFSITFTTFEFS